MGYRDENRNGGILNLGDLRSDLIALYISMELSIDQGIGKNQTPQLTVPPLDFGQTGQLFIHNPGAYDVDGDSISYSAFSPQSNKGFNIVEYTDPAQIFPGGTTVDGTSPAFFRVNSKTGDVIWNTPLRPGIYNVAFKIEEWRTFGRGKLLLSYAIRDMQIVIKEGTNKPPIIKVPEAVCIVANQSYTTSIEVSDPENNPVVIELYGQLSNRTNFTTSTNVTPFRKTFSWTPACTDIRKRPYQAFFKATDLVASNLTSLTDIKTFDITVVGASPTGLKATIDTNKIRLRWDRYTCVPNKDSKLLLYRKVGCGNVPISSCTTGAPDLNFVLLKTLGIAETTFVDSTTKAGNSYSYALAAQFEDGVGLISYSKPALTPSDTCIQLPIYVPLPVKVSFVNDQKDQVLISWQKPKDLDTSDIKGPFAYKLYKKEASEASFRLEANFPLAALPVDTSFLDTNIKKGANYSYYISLEYFNKKTNEFISANSFNASSVEITPTPINKGVRLTWKANTPWANNLDSNYRHKIWRKRPQDSDFILIDSIAFNQNDHTFRYNDIGQFQNEPLKLRDTIQYFVTTSGSYSNDRIRPDELLNNSFIVKGVILDTDAPCAPTLSEFKYDCESFNEVFPFKNTLNWQPQPFSAQCDSDVVKYKVYYSVNSESEEFKLLSIINEKIINNYIHSNLNSVAGCYTITALDAAGNESKKSTKVCLENCYKYELPNVFTPNNSGTNDLFRPIPPSPRFVESVKFKVFNRWGAKVFEKNDDIYLNWDGSGLPDGIYFYTAQVSYFSPDDSKKKEEIKGWIQLIR